MSMNVNGSTQQMGTFTMRSCRDIRTARRSVMWRTKILKRGSVR